MTLEDHEMITERELEQWTHIKVKTLREWRRLGRGPEYQKLGHLVRYKVGDVKRWIDEESHPK